MAPIELASASLSSPLVDLASADEGDRNRGSRVSVYRWVLQLAIVDALSLIILGIYPLILQAGSADLETIAVRSERGAIALGVSLFLSFQILFGGYSTDRILGRLTLEKGVFASLLVTFSMLMMVAAGLKITAMFSRAWFFMWFTSSLVALPLMRIALQLRLKAMLAKGAYAYRAISVGVFCPPLKQSEISNISQGLAKSLAPVRLSNLAQFRTLETVVRDQEIDQVYISVPWAVAPDVCKELAALRHLAMNVYVIPHDAVTNAGLLGVRMDGNQLQMQLVSRPIQEWAYVQKRCLDLAIATLALIAAAPVMALVALAIKLESPGPVLFRQSRQGFNGRRFEVLKFRSMFHDKSDAGAARQTSRHDDRVTRVGRFIRRTSLDELPQILNVLMGEMSIVGPRPHALETRAAGRALEDAASNYAARHRVKPGITGLAQVNGMRGELDSIEKLQRRVELDIAYIDTWSLWLDIKIILKTMLLVIYDPKAY